MYYQELPCSGLLRKGFGISYEYGDEYIFVIGGEDIYKLAIESNLCSQLYITEVYNEFECDTFFPDIPDDFILESDSVWFSENDINFKYETYVVKEPISCETNLIDNPIYASAL